MFELMDGHNATACIKVVGVGGGGGNAVGMPLVKWSPQVFKGWISSVQIQMLRR